MSTAPSAIKNRHTTSTGRGQASQQSQITSGRSNNVFGVVRNPSMLQSENKFDRDNIITKSDLEPTRPSIQKYLEAHTSSINESKMEDASLPSFMDKSHQLPSDASKREFHALQSHASNYHNSFHAYGADSKGPKAHGAGASEATHQPDTTLTSSNKLAQAYKPRTIKQNNSTTKHSEPPVIATRNGILDSRLAEGKLHGSLDKPRDVLMDSADAVTKDSLQLVPLTNKSATINRYASTAGAPVVDDQDSIVKVGLTTGSHGVTEKEEDARGRDPGTKA